MSAGYSGVSPPRVLVPQAPALVAGFREVLWLTPDGEIEALAPAEARIRIEREPPPMLCHARATARRLDVPVFPALDLLELFAFVRPASFCVPTPRGLAGALGIDLPRRPAEECVTLASAARILLEDLGGESDAEARAVAEAMDRGGWLWAPAVIAALPAYDADASERTAGLRVWARPAARQRNGTARGGARAARRAARCRRRAAFGASRLRSGGGCRLRAARPARPAPSRSRRSGNRSGQDARLYRSGEPVGGEEPRVGMDLDIYPQPAEPDRRRARSALPRSRAEAAPRCRPQGA